MVKELSAAVAALGIMKAKYKELDSELRRRFPDVHEKVHDFIDKKNRQKRLVESLLSFDITYINSNKRKRLGKNRQ
jgi:hypothetical protein